MGTEEEQLKKELRLRLSQLDEIKEIRYEIHRLREAVEGRKGLIPIFVESSPDIRTYEQRINRILDPSIAGPLDTDLYIMGYFDQEMLAKLAPVAKHIKIISPKKALDSAKNRDALARINKAGAEVRTHRMLHARIVCVPKKSFLIIGSGDLQTDCFGGRRFDAGVQSNHPDLIKSVMDFFDRVWAESKPLA